MPIPPKYTHQRDNSIPVAIASYSHQIAQSNKDYPHSQPHFPNHSSPLMKSTLYNFTPLIQSHPILPSLDSTHSPNSVLNHLPAHSIRFSSTYSIQIHLFHFDSSLPRSPRRMLNKHAKQSQGMKRHTHHYSLFKHQLQFSPPFSSSQ